MITLMVLAIAWAVLGCGFFAQYVGDDFKKFKALNGRGIVLLLAISGPVVWTLAAADLACGLIELILGRFKKKEGE